MILDSDSIELSELLSYGGYSDSGLLTMPQVTDGKAVATPVSCDDDAAYVPDLDAVLNLDDYVDCYASAYLTPAAKEDSFTHFKVKKEEAAEEEEEFGADMLRMKREVVDEVGCLAVSAAVKDIETACDILDIHPDPYVWTVGDVCKWLQWTAHHYNLPIVQLDNFYMSGATLCSLTEEQFKQYAPDFGTVCYAELDIWKSASVYTKQPQSLTVMPAAMETSYMDMSTLIDQWACGAASPSRSSEVSSEHSVEILSDSETEEAPPSNVQRHSTTIHLWQFLKSLLSDPAKYGAAIRWVDRPRGIFKIEDSTAVAKAWGQRKNRPAMNYDKMSRSLRQYYKKGILKKTERSQRLVYQFCPAYRM
ncbi:PREDICTED: SAM pointed domain-containing Ets transcription factor-like [Priapulus caudatus]|uniref:SAM pointed domain-containing Ets transcription factor-like n=1 Tax=Priapulus caudatus TaxID=37621 RepID=A0ABM1ED28_PRICU|nr:PREDICTED: SAM pointed domain-containing Ets transcription factor-like [Priapulus caudatus]